MLINSKDMEQLTGARSPQKQCQVLRNNGIRFTLRADGRPALSWEAYNRQMALDDKKRRDGPKLELV